MWPATEYAMRKHPNMEAAEAAAISQGPAAWCAERIPHMAPSPRSVNTRNMTKEEMAITECPWGDVHGQCKRSPSATKVFQSKGTAQSREKTQMILMELLHMPQGLIPLKSLPLRVLGRKSLLLFQPRTLPV
jgi:hypothetical protein